MELKRWLDSKQAVSAGLPIGLFYDNPKDAPAGELRSEACIPIEGNLEEEGKFKVKELPSGEIALTRHAGPPEDYTKTYGSFLEGLLREGYTFYGPAREIFEEARENLQPGMGIEIQQLVRKVVRS
jgi:DNA gyrase inhibitor GyrI